MSGKEKGMFYEDEKNQRVRLQEVTLRRSGIGGRVMELSIPGCGPFVFNYDGEELSSSTFDGDPD